MDFAGNMDDPRAIIKALDDKKRAAAIIDGKIGEFRQDGYTNLLTKYGTWQDSDMHWHYRQEAFESDLQLLRLYEGNGLFAKIIDRPAEEAIKHGLDIDFNDEKVADYVENRLDELDYEDKFATAEKWARLYGGAIIVLIVDDGHGLEDPLDWRQVKRIEELRVFERSIVQADYTRLNTFNFYDSIGNNQPYNEPEYYTVSSIYGYFVVHRTRCLVFRNGRLPEQTSSALYRYWGIPEYVKIKRALRECITTHGNGVRLLERSVQAIYKMKNLANLLATDVGEDQALKRLQVIDMARGILNTIAIDSDGEEYDFKSTTMSGVKDIIDSTCNMLSAVTDIPQTILFGRSPAGMNSTGHSDMENYYNMVEKIQKLNMKKNTRTLLNLILRQGVLEGDIDEFPKFKVQFAALWSLTDQEQAQLDQTRAATEKTKADTINVYLQAQVLDPSEVRAGLAKDDDLDIETLIDGTDAVSLPEGSMDFGQEKVASQATNSPGGPPQLTDQGSQLAMAALKAVTGAEDPQADGNPTEASEAEEKATALARAALSAARGRDDGGNRGAELAMEALRAARQDGEDIQYGVGVLIVKDGRVLCAKRSDGQGYCGPGGHMQDDETPEQAAVRETEEEFGIRPTGLKYIGVIPATKDGGCPSCQFIAAGFEGTVKTDGEEMSGAVWATPEELKTVPLFKPFEVSLDILAKASNMDSAMFKPKRGKRYFDDMQKREGTL